MPTDRLPRSGRSLASVVVSRVANTALLVAVGEADAVLAAGGVRRVQVRAGATYPVNQAAGPVDQARSRADRPYSAAVLLGVVGLTGTIFVQYLAFALAPIVAATVLTHGWPLMAAGWLAATVRSRQALAAPRWR